MRLCFFALCFLTFASHAPSAAWEPVDYDHCTPLFTPEYCFRYETSPLSIRNDKSSAEIRRQFGAAEDWKTFPFSGSVTQTGTKAAVELEQANAPSARGFHRCFSVKSVTVTVIIHSITYIAREYRPGSCLYRAQKDRAAAHAQLNRDVLSGSHQAVFEASLRRELAALRPVMFDHGRTKAMETALLKQAQPLVQAELAKIVDARGALAKTMTTRADYLRMKRLCAQ